MKVAVTGSAGFIGKHVVRVIYERGHEHRGFDRESGVYLERDLYSFAGFDAVIHCAALADVRHNWEHVALKNIQRDNVDATMCVLEAARQAESVKTFVFVSSGAVYAEHHLTVDETTPCVASSPYAASKLAGEAYTQAYAIKCGWRWHCVRPAAVFGRGYHHGHIADFVAQARDTGKIHALDRGMTRPAIHVEDLAESLATLALGGPTEFDSGIVNESGGEWSWRDTAAVMGIQATHELRDGGWVGDSKGASWQPRHGRTIVSGVKDSLRSLGWPS